MLRMLLQLKKKSKYFAKALQSMLNVLTECEFIQWIKA